MARQFHNLAGLVRDLHAARAAELGTQGEELWHSFCLLIDDITGEPPDDADLDEDESFVTEDGDDDMAPGRDRATAGLRDSGDELRTRDERRTMGGPARVADPLPSRGATREARPAPAVAGADELLTEPRRSGMRPRRDA